MSIAMTETVVGAIVDTLVSYLPAELAAIDSEKADGVTTTKPTADQILDFSSPNRALDHGVLYEVYEVETLFDGWLLADVGKSRLSSHTTVEIRVRERDAQDGDGGALALRMRRNIAALHRVLAIEHFTAGGAFQVIEPKGVEWSNETEDQALKKATARFRVWIYEVNS